MAEQVLAEVFGFPVDNHSAEAQRHRQARLCPFNNHVPACTKDKADDPLGVCSMFGADNRPAVICPVRFRQDWVITQHAAAFFFPPGTAWTVLSEVRLTDQDGRPAGSSDFVLTAYDHQGRVTDFGALEVQAVYISGNIRQPFEAYMRDPEHTDSGLPALAHPPRPDYLSSSRKRLAPQLMYKGGILHAWGKRQAVALHRGFFDTLPTLPEVSPEEAEIVWLVYGLQLDSQQQIYRLVLEQQVYTVFEAALSRLAVPEPGPVEGFVSQLQRKLDHQLGR